MLTGSFLAVAQFSAPANKGFASSAAVLSIIAATAVGIERIIEAFWTIVGMTKGSWFPMNVLGSQVEGAINNLNVQLEPFYKETTDAINRLEAAKTWSEDKAKTVREEVEALKKQISSFKDLAPDNQKANLIAASAFQGISYFEKKVEGLEDVAVIAAQSVTGLADFVATFKDNPARRLISIYQGAFLGLMVAGFLGLDVFKAAMDSGQSVTTANGFFPYWGVAITGIVMGLGSNPTHEVIRAIQEVKKSRKSGNDPAPSFATSQDNGGFLDAGGGTARPKQINTFSLRRF